MGLVVWCATSCLALGPEWIGKPAPEFTLKTLDGKASHSLEDFMGQVVVIDFWASWCAPCRRSLPKLAALEAGLSGVKVLAVNIDDEQRNGAEFLKQYRVRLLALYDASKTVAAQYDIPAMPSAIVLDKRGIVRYIHPGYTDGDIETLKKEIQGLL